MCLLQKKTTKVMWLNMIYYSQHAVTKTSQSLSTVYRVVQKNRIPSFISGITLVIQHQF